MVPCIFNQEMMIAERRRRAHWLRWLYAGLVMVQLVPLFAAADSFNDWLSGNGFADFFERFVLVHFGLIALVTPAMVAGAITDEKTSGTLQYLLTSYLSPHEIVLGKFLARALPLAVMTLVGLPVIALLSGFGRVGELPVALLLLSLALVFGLAAASILASVWCRQTRDAMLWMYLLGLIGFLTLELATSPRLMALAERVLPLRTLALENGRLNWSRVGSSLLTWSLFGFGCLLVASLRLRGAYLRQLRGGRKAASRWLPVWRPRIRANPVLWRERHVVGLAPLPWLRRWPRWLGCVALVALTLMSLGWALQWILPGGVNLWGRVRAGRWLELRQVLRAAPASGDVFYWHGLAALLAASLVVAIRASGAITEEREQSTWEALLQTPLTTRTILRGKQWGILGACLPYLVSYALAALAVSVFVGVLATAWTVVWFAATVFAGLFAAAVGIWCSARMRTSWQSLVLTLAILYGGSIALTAPTALGAYFLQGLIGIIANVLDVFFHFGIAGVVQSFDPIWLVFGLSFVVAFFFLTHRLMVSAVKQIARRDRARTFDPQHAELHEAWLRQVMMGAGVAAPTDLQPLPLPPEPPEPLVRASATEPDPYEDPDVPLHVPPALNPLADNQKA